MQYSPDRTLRQSQESFLLSNSSVKIFAPDLCSADDIHQRIFVSDGTCPPVGSLASAYLEGALVPKQPWRNPSGDEIEKLFVKSPPPFGRGVGILKLLGPSELASAQAQIRSLGLMSSADPRAIEHIIPSTVISLLKQKCAQADVTRFMGVHRDEGLRETVSINKAFNKYVGLHVDVWESRPIEDRHNSSNRVCVNLGPVPRHFLFVNLTLAQMRLSLKDEIFGSDLGAVGEISKRFLINNPHYPVVRIRIDPGDAYVAPTENILHDGSTFDCERAPFHLNLMGRFDF
jgi:hypothetical protein